MGDGNFHMQLRSHAAALSMDPSYFGDASFFAKQRVFRSYTQAAEKAADSGFNVSPLYKVSKAEH
jgi:hypothetical protein